MEYFCGERREEREYCTAQMSLPQILALTFLTPHSSLLTPHSSLLSISFLTPLSSLLSPLYFSPLYFSPL